MAKLAFVLGLAAIVLSALLDVFLLWIPVILGVATLALVQGFKLRQDPIPRVYKPAGVAFWLAVLALVLSLTRLIYHFVIIPATAPAVVEFYDF